MNENSKKVAEKYKSLFKGYCFNFEGLKEKTKAGFVKLVKEMGAEVCDDAPYIFVEQSYFQKKENNLKDNFYDINYIMEAVETLDSSNLLNHKLVFVHNHQELNDDPMCYASQYIFKTDSCHKCYYEKVFCKECAKNNKESQNGTNKHRRRVVTYSSSTDSSSKSEDEILRTRNKKVGKNRSNISSKRIVTSESEDLSIEEEQSEPINDRNISPPRKKLKNSNLNDFDKTKYECNSPEIGIENNSSKSDIDTVNNSFVEDSIKIKWQEMHKVIKERVVTKNSRASSIDEDDDSSGSSINDKKMQLPKVNKKGSGWINLPKTKIPPPKKEKAAELPDQETEGVLTIGNENEAYFRSHQWWLPHEVPENERCTFPACSYEPEVHPTHFQPKKFLSMVEKKIVVKYLIKKNAIAQSKGKAIYENMIADGYLTHRSWETLRNCFRRTIIKEITSYKLNPEILNKFLVMSDKNMNRVKIEQQ